MNRKLTIAAVTGFFVLLVCSAGPTGNSPCQHKGDVYGKGGKVWVCKQDPDGKLRWNK